MLDDHRLLFAIKGVKVAIRTFERHLCSFAVGPTVIVVREAIVVPRGRQLCLQRLNHINRPDLYSLPDVCQLVDQRRQFDRSKSFGLRVSIASCSWSGSLGAADGLLCWNHNDLSTTMLSRLKTLRGDISRVGEVRID